MDVAALLRYWRNSLADADLRSPALEERVELSPLEIQAGCIGQSSGRLFKMAEELLQGKRRKSEPDKGDDATPLEWVPILIAPFGLKREVQHGVALLGDGKAHYPLWIPAEMDRYGKLRPSPSHRPWLVRSHLEPVPQETLVIGRLADYDAFLTQETLGDGPWKTTFQFADRMLQKVMGCGLANVALEGAHVLPPIAVAWSEDKGISRNLLQLYDEILKANPVSALLRRLAEGGSATPAPEPYALARTGPSPDHCGQMGGSFPLSPSQRQALHSLLSTGAGELIAVNGPPGTGKTTLLQSVVASLWVGAALAQGKPPLILACSSNNRAVTNILDSFASVTSSGGGDPWAERWLPEVDSYGLYLPSSQKFGKTRYQQALPGRPWSGLPAILENAEYVAAAEEHYLSMARTTLPGEPFRTLEEVVSRLQGLLSQGQKELEEWIAEAEEIRSVRQQYGPAGDAASIGPRLRQDREELKTAIADEESLYQELIETMNRIPFWEDLLSFLPAIRERRNRRLSEPYLRRHREPPPVNGPAEAIPSLHRASLERARERLAKVELWEEREARFVKRLSSASSVREPLRPLSDAAHKEPEKVEDLLDCSSRYNLFLLAGRYWEGRWLLEMKRLLAGGYDFKKGGRFRCEERLRRFSMLTPCMVATFYQATKVFEYFDPKKNRSAPLFETIDLLIIDEAGQVSPDVGAAVFALARRAIVVGDVHQIEPVWGVPPAVDNANLESAGLTVDDSDSEDTTAYRASGGSIMLLARRATAKTCVDDRGLFLREHRRSVPEVIRYCNEFVYQGRLQPLRPAKRDRVLPALGWAHLASESDTERGSRINRGQAHAIAAWLESHRQELEEHYRLPLAKIAAVITPFAAQSGVLREELRKRNLSVEAGTVHTFQGGELPVVLFSPVYSTRPQPPSQLFFDAGPNLLNVAVSRARDSFLVFGDMGIFSPRKQCPSGALARLLFESPDNEITDVLTVPAFKDEPDTARISTLDGHRQTLREALTGSESRVLIVSPYLSMAAIQTDKIPEAIAKTKQRNVYVCIVYSSDLNEGEKERNASAAAETLRRAGAEVIASTRIHSKTLAVDGDDRGWIVEGSFNWLSARRDEGHRRQYQEASLCCKGPAAERFIESAWKEIVTNR